MTRTQHLLLLAALVWIGTTQAQPAGPRPDFTGVWQGPFTPDLARPYGKDLPFTAFGRDRFAKVENADDPTSYCLPMGPSRAIQAPFPFQIVQTADTIALLFEYQRTFRIVHLDGRSHPNDFEPEWFGHSIGRWEGNVLIVDTIGINDGAWLDTAGHQHSDKLRMTERFEKTEPNVIRWTATFEDPVYFSEPFSVSLNLKRQNTVIMSYSCEENNRDREHLDAAKRLKLSK